MKSRRFNRARPQEEQLLAYYASEVSKNITNLTAALQTVRDHASLMEKITTIIEALQAVKDLAMIHGYEGVEAVAERMENGARHYLSQNHHSVERFVERMKQAVDVLRRLVEMTDEREAQRLVKETEHVMDYTIDSLNIGQQEERMEVDGAEETERSDRAEALLQENEDHVVRVTAYESTAAAADASEYFDIREPEISVAVPSGDGEYEHTRMVETAVDDVLLGYQQEARLATVLRDSLATGVIDDSARRGDSSTTSENDEVILVNHEAAPEFEEQEDEYVLSAPLPFFMRLKRLFGMG
jgi:chemotaxis protein histidine kinase CheA